MSDQIIPLGLIEAKARAAFERGDGIDAHNFNWHASAINAWQAEWKRCAAARAQQPGQVAEP